MALEYRGLDDQTYEEIVERAKSRLPWLCPAWTDHNAHDPGITILELMAWYKELQQYYMNQVPPSVRRALLKLTGIVPSGPCPASCMVEVEPDGPARLAGTRLASPQGLPFELPEPIPALRTRLAARRIVWQNAEYDVDTLISGDAAFRPFAFRTSLWEGQSIPRAVGYAQADGGSVLRLGFSGRPEEELRLWFDVVEPGGRHRNPPDGQSEPPRTIVWEAECGGAAEVVRDETWHLSWSGFVTLRVPWTWSAGEEGLYWLTVRQAEAGCEEDVRLTDVSANRFRCVQQESRVKRYSFHVTGRFGQEVLIPNAQARYASLAVFRRTAGGWEQTDRYQNAMLAEGRLLRLDMDGCAQDGEDNLLVVSQDTLRTLVYDLKGLPGERLLLQLDGKQVLELELLCQTLEPDGTVRPAFWHRVEDLSVCGPRDTVFLWDGAREEIVFGDGQHGAIPEAGEGTALVSSLVLSACAGGNLPAGTWLSFPEDGRTVRNSAASGGKDGETLDEARSRLLRKLEDTDKCQSAADYARCAMKTPGLRLAGAKALPGYDAYLGTGRRHTGYVSVLVLPVSETDRPAPDSRFLSAVDRQLERYRPVCVQVKAIAPRYVPLALSVRVLVQPGTSRTALETSLRNWLLPRAELAGEVLRRNDALALLQKADGVLQVYQADFRPLGSGGYLTSAGDLRLPPDGLASLERVDIELVEA